MERLIPNSQFKSDEILLEEKQFGVNLVQSVCKDILDENLYDLKYNAARCKVLATELSERMRNEVRAITASKYKVISTIFYPYINTDENVSSEHSDNDDENQPVNMENILENIKKLHNNLPHDDKKFRFEIITEMAERILQEDLTEVSYDPVKCRLKSKELSDRIRDAVKELGLERYKFVCTVSIGSLGEQGFRLGSRCLWCSMTDASATAVFKNSSLFAVAIVFGVYVE